MQRKRNKSIEESLKDATFVEATERVKRKLNNTMSGKSTLDCATWRIKQWITCIDTLLSEFGVPADDWRSSNQFKQKKLTENFVKKGLEVFKTPAALLEVLVNIIVTWNDPEKRFFSRHITEFNVGYVTKAFSTYVKRVKEKPTSRLAAYDVSKDFSRRMGNMLAGAYTTEWLQDIEPQKWDDHGEVVNPLDDLL